MDLNSETVVTGAHAEIQELLTHIMNIAIYATHMDLTEGLKERIRAQFKRLEKVLDPNARIDVEIGKTTDHHKNGNIYKAEAKIVEPKAEYFADIITTDLYTSIDSLSDEMFQQVTKSKSKHRALLKRGQSAIKKLLRL